MTFLKLKISSWHAERGRRLRALIPLRIPTYSTEYLSQCALFEGPGYFVLPQVPFKIISASQYMMVSGSHWQDFRDHEPGRKPGSWTKKSNVGQSSGNWPKAAGKELLPLETGSGQEIGSSGRRRSNAPGYPDVSKISRQEAVPCVGLTSVKIVAMH